jgi:hypothetical protein
MVERYEIRVEGHLDERWRAWFDGLTIRNEPSGEATLSGAVADQAALHGVLARLRDLNLPIVALARLTPEDTGLARASAEAERQE